MRSRLVAVLAAALTTALTATPASFADSGAVIVRWSLPDDVYLGSAHCDDFNALTPINATHETGPGTPVHGAGSVRLGVQAGSLADFSPSNSLQLDPANLYAFSFDTYVPAGSNLTALGMIGMTADDPTDIDMLLASGPPTATWSTTNMLTASLTWETWHQNGTQSSLGSGTFAQYVSAHPDHQVILANFRLKNCTQSVLNEIYLDSLTIAYDGGGNSWDFEPALPTGLDVSLSRTKAVAGQVVRPRATLTSGGDPVQGATVDLWAKPAGGGGFTKIASSVTDDTGAVQSTQHPTRTTTYEWRFAGNDQGEPKSSAGRTVHVARKLTLRVADASLRATQKLHATGAESPRSVGSTVTVWRHDKHGTHKVGTATVGGKGTWSLSKDLPKGTWSIYATAPKDSAHIASRSAARTVTSA
jgi:hypothetical protein